MLTKLKTLIACLLLFACNTPVSVPVVIRDTVTDTLYKDTNTSSRAVYVTSDYVDTAVERTRREILASTKLTYAVKSDVKLLQTDLAATTTKISLLSVAKVDTGYSSLLTKINSLGTVTIDNYKNYVNGLDLLKTAVDWNLKVKADSLAGAVDSKLRAKADTVPDIYFKMDWIGDGSKTNPYRPK